MRLSPVVVTLVLASAALHAQSDQAPPPPAEPTAPLPAPDAPPSSDFVPFTPAPTEAPPPTETAPPPTGITATPLQPPPPAQKAAPSRPANSDECRATGKGKGFFRGSIPSWAGGAVVGGAVGALGLSLVALGVAAAVNFAIVQKWVGTPNANLPGLYSLPLLALPLGAVLGAVVGGVVTPFLPPLPLTRPCVNDPGADPTSRPSGVVGTPGSGTAG